MFEKEKKDETMFIVTMGYDDIYIGISITPALFRNLKDAENYIFEAFKNRTPKKTWEEIAFEKFIRRTYVGEIMNMEKTDTYFDGWCELNEVKVR